MNLAPPYTSREAALFAALTNSHVALKVVYHDAGEAWRAYSPAAVMVRAALAGAVAILDQQPVTAAELDDATRSPTAAAKLLRKVADPAPVTRPSRRRLERRAGASRSPVVGSAEWCETRGDDLGHSPDY